MSPIICHATTYYRYGGRGDVARDYAVDVTEFPLLLADSAGIMPIEDEVPASIFDDEGTLRLGQFLSSPQLSRR